MLVVSEVYAEGSGVAAAGARGKRRQEGINGVSDAGPPRGCIAASFWSVSVARLSECPKSAVAKAFSSKAFFAFCVPLAQPSVPQCRSSSLSVALDLCIRSSSNDVLFDLVSGFSSCSLPLDNHEPRALAR